MMGKRFTSAEKWSDPWFRGLSCPQKTAWHYLCDCCDVAGVIDLDRELANFLIRDTLDWDAFIEAAGEKRIAKLPCGKLWLVGFVEFQYGELTESCAPHRAVLKILGKYGLIERVAKGLAKGCQTPKEKEKDKDKDSSGKGDARGKPRVTADMVPVPKGWNTGDVLAAIQDWLAYKAKRGEEYRDAAYLGRKLREFAASGPQSFIDAVNSSIGSNYAGLFPAKGPHGKQQPGRVGPGQRYRETG